MNADWDGGDGDIGKIDDADDNDSGGDDGMKKKNKSASDDKTGGKNNDTNDVETTTHNTRNSNSLTITAKYQLILMSLLEVIALPPWGLARCPLQQWKILNRAP